MQALAISETRDYFVQHGKSFFYLADTLWSTFTNISFEEWEEFLNYRKMQGFNVLQINILPQWDRSESDHDSLEPFHRTDSGRWDFSKPQDAYFSKAKRMVAIAREKGFLPALVLLWCNYVKDTWGSKRLPGYEIPKEAVHPYVKYVCDVFSEYKPLFLVSGDTDLKSQEAIDIYLAALDAAKEFCPDALTTFHLNPSTDLPQQVIDAPGLDFYMYQSGHHAEEQANAYTLAQRFATKSVKRPVVNGEPCYDGHGFGDNYGRFSAFHVRRAVWQSLLSGAKAGFTYGAHGIWNWHEKGKAFPNPQFSSHPYSWRTAMRLQGAWDAGFVRWIFETYELFDTEPNNDILNNHTPEIRVATSPNQERIVVYMPFNTDVNLTIDLNMYECSSFNLTDRLVAHPEIQATPNGSMIRMHEFNSDILVVGVRKDG